MENFDHNSAENYNFDEGQIWKFKMPVWNLLDDDKNWVEKSKTQKSLERKDNFVDGQIWQSKMLVRNLLHDNSLPQEKSWV